MSEFYLAIYFFLEHFMQEISLEFAKTFVNKSLLDTSSTLKYFQFPQGMIFKNVHAESCALNMYKQGVPIEIFSSKWLFPV